ncbi:DnaJ domain-containing protein [Desulfobacterales bacterium HSG16]|nr:DnaJ domain-containing protein [Desulfobacterales bacterium HSG16]
MDNFYHILNVSENAENQDIKKSFRSLAKQYHPDTSSLGDSEKFRKISHAYKILSDPASRYDYDKALNNFREKTGGIGDYTSHVHTVDGKHLKRLLKEILNQGHLTSIAIRFKGKKLVEFSAPMAAGITLIGAIKAPIAFLLLNIGVASFFEVEVTNQVITMYKKAFSSHESGNIIEAEGLYRNILKQSEYFVPAHMNLGMLYRQRGESKKAVQCFTKVLDMSPFGEIGDIARRQLKELRGF